MDRAVWISGEEKLLNTTAKLIFSGSSNVLNGYTPYSQMADTREKTGA